MGKKKLATMDASTEEKSSAEDVKKEQAKEKKAKAVKHAKAKAQAADAPFVDESAIAEHQPADATEETTESTAPIEKPKKAVKQSRTRGKKYADARSQVDKTKTYTLSDAIELVKHMSYTKFDASIEAHLQVKEAGLSVNVTFPHNTGKTLNIAVLDEKVLASIQKGNYDFDVLLAKPEDMKKLTKFAKDLGPKGLMPNPKSGTLTPNPAAKKKELEAGAITVKSERKAPLIHVLVGKVSMPSDQIAENVTALLKAVDTKATKLHICASMTPSVRVAL